MSPLHAVVAALTHPDADPFAVAIASVLAGLALLAVLVILIGVML